MTDPVALYRLHRFRAGERGMPLRAVTRAPDPIAYHAAEMANTYAYWLRIGYYRRQRDGTLRLTPKGALCTVWRGKFPWLQITRRHDRRVREATLARYTAATA